MTKPLNQYRGPLSALQAAEGINAAERNARRLAEDAKLLLTAERFPSAASLALLALEEYGKVGILRLLVLADSQKKLADNWRRYRRHTEKNFLILIPALIKHGAKKLHDFKSIFTTDSDSRRATYDTLKQLGFYTDCCGPAAHWSIPAEVIGAELAAYIVSLAEALTSEEPHVTALELELWVSHVSGVVTLEKLLKWCSAMVEAGLKPPEFIEEMREFVQGFADTASRMRNA